MEIRQLILIALVALPAAGPLPPAATAADIDGRELLRRTSQAFADVAEAATPAVVSITAERRLRAGPGQHGSYHNELRNFYGDELLQRFFRDYYGVQPRQYLQTVQGSGFLISKDGYILTNNHVVGDADRIRVRLNDGREFDATQIGSDPKSEVALIDVDGEDFPFLPIGDSDALRIGEWVIAIGNPLGLSESVTVGNVSAKGRSDVRIADYEDFIQTDAAINPGNSGGPLLDIDGRAVGINTAIYSRDGGSMGIGFAIPINMAMAIKEQLIATGHVVRGFLGVNIQDVTAELAELFGLDAVQGVLIANVQPGSPAERAGLQVEDVIVDLDGEPVPDAGALRNRVSSRPPGTAMSLGVIREGKRTVVTAEAGYGPGEEPDGSGELTVEDDAARGKALYAQLGMTVEAEGGKDSRLYGIRRIEGLVVTGVDPGGAAHRTGIEPGDRIDSVNRRPVTTRDAFVAALAESGQTRAVLLRVHRGNATQYVVLRLDDSSTGDR